jgi:hypothetical protein
MPRLDVDVDVKATEARQFFVEADEKSKKAVGEVAEDVGESIRKQMVRSLFRQGSVKTGEGYRSLRVRQGKNKNTRQLVGRSYLQALDEGTQPHTPRIDHRLRFWARSEGWNPQALARHIGTFGTNAHPFIDKSIDVGVISAKNTTLKTIKKNIT